MGDKLVTIRVAEEMEPLHCETRRFRRPTKSGSPAYYYAFYETDIVSVEDAPMEEPPVGTIIVLHPPEKWGAARAFKRYGSITGQPWMETNQTIALHWTNILTIANGDEELIEVVYQPEKERANE